MNAEQKLLALLEDRIAAVQQILNVAAADPIVQAQLMNDISAHRAELEEAIAETPRIHEERS